MNKCILFFALMIGAVFGKPVPAAAQAVPPSVVKAFADAGLPVPGNTTGAIDFTLPLLDGTHQKLSDLKGNVVFLNFWATWCPPCRQEMPSMETFYQRFKGRGLEILAVDCQEELRDVSAFMRRNRLSFPAALDTSGKVSSDYGISAIPTTYVIDRSGKIILKVVGGRNWDNPKIIAAFEALLTS
jgi:peroxiredoxin